MSQDADCSNVCEAVMCSAESSTSQNLTALMTFAETSQTTFDSVFTEVQLADLEADPTFNSAFRADYRDTVARSAGVDLAKVIITAISDVTSVSRRSLLAAGITVETAVDFDESESNQLEEFQELLQTPEAVFTGEVWSEEYGVPEVSNIEVVDLSDTFSPPPRAENTDEATSTSSGAGVLTAEIHMLKYTFTSSTVALMICGFVMVYL
eukprot:gene1914-2596_t